MGKSKYTNEQIIDAVKDSFSFNEVLAKIGASRTSGSSHKSIKKRIIEMELDITHFKRVNPNLENIKLTPNEILVYDRRNGLRERSQLLRRAIIDSGVIEICECGQDCSWNGKFLQLEIDHIDDNPLNNVITNLRFICPNCHSQKHINYNH